MKSLSIFPLYIFSFNLKFVLLVKSESTRGPGEGMDANQRKIGEKDKNEEFQIRNH